MAVSRLWILVSAMLALSACGSSNEDSVASLFSENPRVFPVTLSTFDNARLGIGFWPKLPYRGGLSEGTLTVNDPRNAHILFPAETSKLPPLVIAPGVAEVVIVPKVLEGTVNLCTGDVNIAFDARFEPTTLGRKMAELSVVTQLTTGVSVQGDQRLVGRPLDDIGSLRLVGIALVPKTDKLYIDRMLGLPANATTEMNGIINWPSKVDMIIEEECRPSFL